MHWLRSCHEQEEGCDAASGQARPRKYAVRKSEKEVNDTIDDKLKRLNAEFDKLLNPTYEKNLQKLIRYGLTEEEAKAWLDQEPNYTRRILTRKKSDEDLTEPWCTILLSYL